MPEHSVAVPAGRPDPATQPAAGSAAGPGQDAPQDGPEQPAGSTARPAGSTARPAGSTAQPAGSLAQPAGTAELGASRGLIALTIRVLGSRAFRWGFVALTVALGAYAVASQWHDVRGALADLGPVAALGALVSVLVALAATMQMWRVLLAALGSPLPVAAAARIMFVGQLGKYLPGSIWPVLAQMELGTTHKVPRHRTASASVLTMLLSLLGALLTGLVTLPFTSEAASYRWVFLAAPVLLISLYPAVLNAILRRLLRLAKRPPLEKELTGRAIAAALGWSVFSWICYGVQVWLLMSRLHAGGGTAILLATGGFAFAWSVGFLVIFAPAGAGIREVLLVAALSPVLGVGDATAVTLVSRVLTTAGDLLTAAVAAGFTRRRAAPHDGP